MDNSIQKERIYLFSPTPNLCAIAEINHPVGKAELERAFTAAVSHHEILCSKITVEGDGSAFFHPIESEPRCTVTEYTSDWATVALQQEKVAFDLGKGETARFFCRYCDNRTQLLVIVHHLVGDGNSLMLFMDDVLKVLNQQPIEHKPLQLLKSSDVPGHPGLNWLMRAMMKRTNSRWSKSGKVFAADTYDKMFTAYHSHHQTAILMKTFDSDALHKLSKIAHGNSITLNSLLVTAFATEDAPSDIGVAVNLRPDNFRGMGNYAVGIGIKTAYDAHKSFLENAKVIHGLISEKLMNKNKFFLYEFMNALSPTLIDSIYFTMTGEYSNAVSDAVRNMCGYVSSPTGTSITNLTTIRTSEQPEWTYMYDCLFFVPPYVPNVRRIIGISTYKDTLTLTSHFPSDKAESEKQAFDRACAALHKLAEQRL